MSPGLRVGKTVYAVGVPVTEMLCFGMRAFNFPEHALLLLTILEKLVFDRFAFGPDSITPVTDSFSDPRYSANVRKMRPPVSSRSLFQRLLAEENLAAT
jgi:hypothetical protein